MESLHRSPISTFVSGVISLKDEIFMLCQAGAYDSSVSVYNRNNTAQVKDVIPLPKTSPVKMASCGVSNCVYVLDSKISDYISVLRIRKNDQHRFKVSPFIVHERQPDPIMSVTPDGRVILSSQKHWGDSAEMSVYDTSGSFQRAVKFNSEIIPRFSDIIATSYGTFVLVPHKRNRFEEKKLTEIDKDGVIVRQSQLSIGERSVVCCAGISGQIGVFTAYARRGFALLDSEFNPTYCSGPHPDDGPFVLPCDMSFNSERNEVVGIYRGWLGNRFLIIFRFI